MAVEGPDGKKDFKLKNRIIVMPTQKWPPNEYVRYKTLGFDNYFIRNVLAVTAEELIIKRTKFKVRGRKKF